MRYLTIIWIVLITTKGIIYCQEKNPIIEELAMFQGHEASYFRDNFVMPNLHYPDSAKINCVQGRVVIKFTIDSFGQISETKILKSLCDVCDNEVIRVIKLSSGMWSPAKNLGKGIESSFVIPIDFNLKESDCVH